MTLTDFLLARIAEDEDDVRRRGTIAVGHAEQCIYEGGYEGTTHCDCGAVDRVLVEREAKRRIVSLASSTDSSEIHADAWTVCKWVVRELAAVYADHPDYRDEWKP